MGEGGKESRVAAAAIATQVDSKSPSWSRQLSCRSFSCHLFLRGSLTGKMAVARPIRMLGASCIILILFLIFQMNKTPTFISKGPYATQPYEGITSDPLKERTLPQRHSLAFFRIISITSANSLSHFHSNWRTDRPFMACDRWRLFSRQHRLPSGQRGTDLSRPQRGAQRADSIHA